MGLMTGLFGGISQAEAARDPGAWLDESGMGMRTTAGVSVGPDNAISLSAVFASVRAISEDVGCLPIKVYRNMEGGGKQPASDEPKWDSPSLDKMVNSYTLLHDTPNEDMSDLDFRSLLIWWAALWGNGYAEIVRANGMPTALYPIHPHRVKAKRDDSDRLYYEVRNDTGNPSVIRPRDMIHVSGPSDDGVVGLMVTKYAKEAFGIYMAAEQFTGSYFGSGATLAGVITFDKQFATQEARAKYRDDFNRVYQGSRNAGKWMLADGEGVKVTQLGSNADDAQLVETLSFRIEDVARWFRVPPVIIGHNTATPYSNVEPLGQIYTKFGLKPWAKRLEKEFTRKVLDYADDMFAEHVVDSLMWADAKTRAEVHNLGIRGGWKTPDEVRSSENMNPYPGGNKFRVEQNLALIDEQGMPVQVNRPQDAAPAEPRNNAEAMKLAAMPMFVDAAERMITREAKAFGRKSDPDAAWIDKFYQGHRSEVAAAFAPAIDTLARLTCGNPDGLAERYADMHVGESKRRLSEGEDPAVWMTDRPAWIARFLTDEAVA